MARRRAQLGLFMTLAVALISCGSAEELRRTEQTSKFISDIALITPAGKFAFSLPLLLLAAISISIYRERSSA